MAGGISIVIADNHALFRTAIRTLLESSVDSEFEVVGEASDGEEAIALVGELRPDVVGMDLDLGGASGLRATRRISALEYRTQILVVTSLPEEKYVVPAIAAGASGYLNKAAGDRELFEAVRTVSTGQVYLPSSATTLVLKHYREGNQEVTTALATLTSREQEVAALTAEGFSAREIGEKLFIGSKTVETYRSRIMRKVGLGHRSELVQFALQAGLLGDL